MKSSKSRLIQKRQKKNQLTFLMVAMKSSIAEVMWKRMMAAKIINMADGGTENQKQENLLKKKKEDT